MNEIRNALVMPVEDPVSNNILCNALEVCNKGSIRKKLKLHLITENAASIPSDHDTLWMP
jgi:hypothetical protein